MERTIPSGSIEIQKGLWLHEYKKIIVGVEYTRRELYSSKDYCFYIVDTEETEEENKTYYQYASLGIGYNSLLHTELNQHFISIPLTKDIIVA